MSDKEKKWMPIKPINTPVKTIRPLKPHNIPVRNMYSITKIKPTGIKAVDDLTKIVSANVIDLTKEVKKLKSELS